MDGQCERFNRSSAGLRTLIKRLTGPGQLKSWDLSLPIFLYWKEGDLQNNQALSLCNFLQNSCVVNRFWWNLVQTLTLEATLRSNFLNFLWSVIKIRPTRELVIWRRHQSDVVQDPNVICNNRFEKKRSLKHFFLGTSNDNMAVIAYLSPALSFVAINNQRVKCDTEFDSQHTCTACTKHDGGNIPPDLKHTWSVLRRKELK
jgi:hypothetical protein